MQVRKTLLMDWLRESRWRSHVIFAARCAGSGQSAAVQGPAPRQSIGVQREAALESRGAAGSSIPPAGCIATFVENLTVGASSSTPSTIS
jgi:hypothetical protein